MNVTPLTSDWLSTFVIPEHSTFSKFVHQAIDTGLVSSRARREIIQTLRTLVLQYTHRPTADQYNGVCLKLIQKYPCFRDEIGSGFVSTSACNN